MIGIFFLFQTWNLLFVIYGVTKGVITSLHVRNEQVCSCITAQKYFVNSSFQLQFLGLVLFAVMTFLF